MASDSDKSTNNLDLDGYLKNNKKQASGGNTGDSSDKTNPGVPPVAKGGRHLSIPFDSATANGDLRPAAEAAEAIKLPKYKALDAGYNFVAFGVKALGPWGPGATELFHQLVKRLVDVTGEKRAGSVLAQRLGIAIQRGNAASILGTMPQVSGAVEGPRAPRDRPPWRCYGPMLTHSRSDGDFPIYARDFLHVGAKEVAAVAAKKQNGTTVRTNSLGSGARTPPVERTKSKFSAFGRLFKPWKWKRKKKSEKFEAASRTLERKISVRANREELVQKGILLPESPITPVPEANEESPSYEEARAETAMDRGISNAHAALQAQLASQLQHQQAALASALAAAAAHHSIHQNNNIIEPKKDKLENGGEMMRPERPNSLTAGKHTRRICYQGDVGGGYGEGDEQLVLSELPEPPIALSEIGPIPPPPMFSSPSPTRHHQHQHQHQHARPHHTHSDSEDSEEGDEEEEQLTAAADTSRVEEIPPKEPSFNAVPLKSALKKRPAHPEPGTPLAPRQDHHHASFKRPPPKPRTRFCSRPVRIGNAMENKENARPWEGAGEYRDEHGSESDRVAAKLARKESLNIKLALRPDRQELINRNILVVQSECERQESWEAIGARLIRRLSMRPTAEELVERNILKSQSPAEEKKQKEEKKRYLLRKLSFRPTVDELKEKKIIRFSDYIEVTQAHDYDRRADKPWTRLTPRDKAAIRRELNEFKSSEMAVHEDSKHLTRFHRP